MQPEKKENKKKKTSRLAGEAFNLSGLHHSRTAKGNATGVRFHVNPCGTLLVRNGEELWVG
ncbi:hypothetical protein E2C01_089718 [Portunus trituberculatus]|uniref:Uncharacterized protein n=1 Tax=Portunus trituberculatus TaxID=210409 RepID=A0A5B7JQC6_PORTR|nr:hypothetical protein [Portunus trituberculatus]